MKPPHERALRPDTTLDSPATRGKLPSPERGGQTKNLSVHPSTKTGQLQAVADASKRSVVPWTVAKEETMRILAPPC